MHCMMAPSETYHDAYPSIILPIAGQHGKFYVLQLRALHALPFMERSLRLQPSASYGTPHFKGLLAKPTTSISEFPCCRYTGFAIRSRRTAPNGP